MTSAENTVAMSETTAFWKQRRLDEQPETGLFHSFFSVFSVLYVHST